MKIKHFFYQLPLFLIFLFSFGVQASASPKILIMLAGDDSTAETLLAKQLLTSDYQVMTSGEVMPSSWLRNEDILEAKKGNMQSVRKVAAFCDAGFILTGSVKTGMSSNEVQGVKLDIAVTTLNYKLVDTASGKVLDTNIVQDRGAGRSADEAQITSLSNLAANAGEGITEKLSGFSADMGMLSQFKNRFGSAPPPVVATAEPPPVPAVSRPPRRKPDVQDPEPVQAEPKRKPQIPYSSEKEKSEKEKPVQSKRQGSPRIVITNPPVTRGFKVVEKKKITIEGTATDDSGIRSVEVNGKPADVDEKGNFTYNAALSPGDNPFRVRATNTAGNSSEKEFSVTCPAEKKDITPPEIIVTSARSSSTRGLSRSRGIEDGDGGRGFKVVPKPQPAEEASIEGRIKDESGILYAKINGEELSLDRQGFFSKKIAMSKTVVIEAADKAGNSISKEVPLSSGTRGESDESASVVPSESSIRPVLWGLSIGVSKYGNSNISLQYADKDALSLAEFFKKQEGRLFSEIHFKTLLNEEVTRTSIIENISGHLGQAAPDDVVFIFIAGHGIKHRQSGSYYFVPYDADFETILSKGLRMSDFDEAVNILSKNVNKVVIAMDTCNSGALQVGARALDGGEDLAEALKTASGLFILSASKGGEESLEDAAFKLDKEDTGHGAFTYSMIEGMSGKANNDGDNYISLNELFQYVAKHVPRLTKGRQHPYFRSEGTDMPFVILSE
jgi:hypothetical protein